MGTVRQNQDQRTARHALRTGIRTGNLEKKLNADEFLVGDHLTAADIACASPLYLADLSEHNASNHPISSFFHKHMHLGDGREKTRGWIRRVIAWDPVLGRSGTTV